MLDELCESENAVSIQCSIEISAGMRNLINHTLGLIIALSMTALRVIRAKALETLRALTHRERMSSECNLPHPVQQAAARSTAWRMGLMLKGMGSP
jgi:hypothetical protein